MKILIVAGCFLAVVLITWGVVHDSHLKYKTGVVYQKSYTPESDSTGTVMSSSGKIHTVSSHSDAKYEILLTNGVKLEVNSKQYVEVEKGDKVKYKDGVFSDSLVKIK